MINTIATIAAFVLLAALFISMMVLIKTKDLPDKVVALNLVGAIIMGMSLTVVLISGDAVYLDVALAAIVINFLGTVMIARYLKRKTYDE